MKVFLLRMVSNNKGSMGGRSPGFLIILSCASNSGLKKCKGIESF